jgi:hypothetical protein
LHEKATAIEAWRATLPERQRKRLVGPLSNVRRWRASLNHGNGKMSQRDSGYERKALDCYETPHWVTECLLPHIPERITSIWECAAGSGRMVAALMTRYTVCGTDIDCGRDSLAETKSDYPAIITNPPYSLAQRFIEHALNLTRPHNGFGAMLLRCDFDHAKTRQHLFGQCPQFAKKLVLTRRIRWIEGSNGSPSFNHAWFVWSWRHQGPPTLAYA